MSARAGKVLLTVLVAVAVCLLSARRASAQADFTFEDTINFHNYGDGVNDANDLKNVLRDVLVVANNIDVDADGVAQLRLDTISRRDAAINGALADVSSAPSGFGGTFAASSQDYSGDGIYTGGTNRQLFEFNSDCSTAYADLIADGFVLILDILNAPVNTGLIKSRPFKRVMQEQIVDVLLNEGSTLYDISQMAQSDDDYLLKIVKIFTTIAKQVKFTKLIQALVEGVTEAVSSYNSTTSVSRWGVAKTLVKAAWGVGELVAKTNPLLSAAQTVIDALQVRNDIVKLADNCFQGRRLSGPETDDSFLGCSLDNSLTLLTITSAGMKPEWCRETCEEGGYQYSLTWGGNYCSCDHSPPYLVSSSYCTQTCTADSAQYCGGGNWISGYYFADAWASTNYIGCFKDTWSRAFSHKAFQGTETTVDGCMDHCRNAGYEWAGLQDGRQCFCGTSSEDYDRHGMADNCDKPCTGESTQRCGGTWAMSVWHLD